MNGSFLNRLLMGIIIIALGVVFLLRQTGYLDFDISIGSIFSTFWPVILLYVGLKGLIMGLSNGSGSSWWGGIVTLIGFIFLGHNLEWFTWSIGDIVPYIWPVAVILIGVNLLRKPRKQDQSPPSDEWKSYNAYWDTKGDVPSAPPLHPDPTKAKEPGQESFQDDANQSNEQSQKVNADDDYSSETYSSYNKKYKKSKPHTNNHKYDFVEYWDHNPSTQTRSGFIGDIHIGHEYWDLKPMNISHFIGDTVVDLTKAQIPFGVTKLCISSFIGDVKVYVPNDYEVGVQVVSSAFIGDVKILGRKDGGILKSMNINSPAYEEADKKIKLVVSTFIGDVRVTKVG